MSGEEIWNGVAVYQQTPNLISGILAEFILDYRAFDPAFCTSKSAASFRGGVLTVTADVFPQFLRALSARPIPPHEVSHLVDSSNALEILVFVDCDSQLYVHSYYDLALEDYVPRGWRGELGDPAQALKQWYFNKMRMQG